MNSENSKTNLKADHKANNADVKHLIIIPCVPLQPNINEIIGGNFHSLINVFFRLAGSAKTIVIGNMWRAQL